MKRQYYKDGGFVYTIRLVENKKIKASPIQRGQALLKNSGNALIKNTSVHVELSQRESIPAQEQVQNENVSDNIVAQNTDSVNREFSENQKNR